MTTIAQTKDCESYLANVRFPAKKPVGSPNVEFRLWRQAGEQSWLGEPGQSDK